jgi:isocitrate dehydrogenase
VLGSAVNPVLREGNSDRRVAAPVKAYARAHPHKLMAWPADSKTKVVHMSDGDFFGSEQSAVVAADTTARIEFVAAAGGAVTPLKKGLKLVRGEVVDASRMSVRALRAFYEGAFAGAKAAGAAHTGLDCTLGAGVGRAAMSAAPISRSSNTKG